MSTDTIVALATAPGRAGIGVIRLSGPKAFAIATELGAANLTPRLAKFCHFQIHGEAVDSGLALAFPGPASFTGEDVVELQAHGSPVTLKQLIRCCLGLGARLANPGEFSQRAFLNGRIDLAQAEAIADLISSGSESAARAAMRSLDGVFSRRIDQLAEQIIELRKYVEAAIDFAEEEIDFLGDGKIASQLQQLLARLEETLAEGKKGQKLLQGLNIVILGEPNAGKSSLLNHFAGDDRAIVTDVAGTTRDTLTETIDLGGLPISITDTAGLNAKPDPVEKIGIERALQSARKADLVLVLFDSNNRSVEQTRSLLQLHQLDRASADILLVANKTDLSTQTTGWQQDNKGRWLGISVKQREGLEELAQALHEFAGLQGEAPAFSARDRHLVALQQASSHLQQAIELLANQQAGELVAEELRLGHLALQEITGCFSSDDLLGEIFSSFCVGK